VNLYRTRAAPCRHAKAAFRRDQAAVIDLEVQEPESRKHTKQQTHWAEVATPRPDPLRKYQTHDDREQR
jgi:hypothetical protein